MRRGTRDDANDQWGKRKAVLLSLDPPGIFIRMRLRKNIGTDLAGTGTPSTFEEDESPGGELTMIRHPRRKCQQNFDLLRRRTRPGHRRRRRRAPCSQKGDHFIHWEFMLSLLRSSLMANSRVPEIATIAIIAIKDIRQE